MKKYTKEEKIGAKKKLPKPVSDFLSSEAISDIYAGIARKHTLELLQEIAVSEGANVVLLGLEPESAFETNLHQTLPELSANTMRELVADIKDRIFKEARRRLQEHITESEPEWNESELGPKPKEGDSLILTDKELEELETRQEKEGWKPPEEEDESVPDPNPEQEDSESRAETQIIPPETTSLAQEKLKRSVVTKTEVVTVTPQSVGIQNISVPKPPEILSFVPQTPSVPQTSSNQIQTPVPAAQFPPSQGYKGVDPYREPVE